MPCTLKRDSHDTSQSPPYCHKHHPFMRSTADHMPSRSLSASSASCCRVTGCMHYSGTSGSYQEISTSINYLKEAWCGIQDLWTSALSVSHRLGLLGHLLFKIQNNAICRVLHDMTVKRPSAALEPGKYRLHRGMMRSAERGQ